MILRNSLNGLSEDVQSLRNQKDPTLYRICDALNKFRVEAQNQIQTLEAQVRAPPVTRPEVVERLPALEQKRGTPPENPVVGMSKEECAQFCEEVFAAKFRQLEI